MSWSMMEPEGPPICECKYDEARDEMDREDCPFHYDLVEDSFEQSHTVHRKAPTSTTAKQHEDAA
jgi:hypothetical protein